MNHTELLSRIESTVREHRMISPGERLLVACSGGADSVALFHFLRELCPRLKIRLGLLHFDHALRKASARDSAFVRRMAARFGVPFYAGRREPGPARDGKNLSVEEAARRWRYEFFVKTAKRLRIRKIALAHHRDDQAETVLMRVIQGTGPRGLQGIRPVVRWKGVALVRPLLALSRREVRSFLKKIGIRYREDPTNRSVRFLRNRIRHRLLPLLEKQFNPQIRASLCRLAQTSAAEVSGLDDWAKKNWKAFLGSRKNGLLRVRRNSFLALPGALQFRLMNQMLKRLDPQSGLDFKAWKRMEEGLCRKRYRVNLPRNIDFCLTPKTLFVKRVQK